MKKRIFWTIWCILSMILVIIAGAKSFAQDDFSIDEADLGEPAEVTEEPAAEKPAAPGNLINPDLKESEQVDLLAKNFKFEPMRKDKDPFRAIIEKQVILPPVPRQAVSANTPKGPPPPPPPKPIQLFVQGIVGNDQERLAVVKFENEIQTIEKDMVVKGKFKVVDILPDRVVVYSNKEQMRRTFPIGDGKDIKD